MATLIELRNFMNDSALRNKVTTAVIISADTVMRGNDGSAPFLQKPGPPSDHDIRVIWAKLAFENPQAEGRKFLMSVLASNSTLAVGAITGASDAAIQSNVDEAVDLMAGVVV